MIEAIVLAAGKGERLGMIKPLVMIDGEPALARVIRTLKKAQIERIIIVLGYAAKTILRDVNLTGCKVVINSNYKVGMASSLALGIESLSAKAQGFLILHADMPYLKEETIRAVLTKANNGAQIAAPTHHGQRGFPVYLRRSCIVDLLPTLVGEIGARQYIAQHQHKLALVKVDDPGAVRDIDRLEDLKMVEEKRGPTILEG